MKAYLPRRNYSSIAGGKHQQQSRKVILAFSPRNHTRTLSKQYTIPLLSKTHHSATKRGQTRAAITVDQAAGRRLGLGGEALRQQEWMKVSSNDTVAPPRVGVGGIGEHLVTHHHTLEKKFERRNLHNVVQSQSESIRIIQPPNLYPVATQGAINGRNKNAHASFRNVIRHATVPIVFDACNAHQVLTGKKTKKQNPHSSNVLTKVVQHIGMMATHRESGCKFTRRKRSEIVHCTRGCKFSKIAYHDVRRSKRQAQSDYTIKFKRQADHSPP